MKRKLSCAVFLVLIAVFLFSCQYEQYPEPRKGIPINNIDDPNRNISRDMDGEDINTSFDEETKYFMEECSYSYYDIPSKKIVKTYEKEGQIQDKKFTTVSHGKWTVNGKKYLPDPDTRYSDYMEMSYDLYVTTDEIRDRLVELVVDIEPSSTTGGKPNHTVGVHPAIMDLLPAAVWDILKNTPNQGTWQIVMGENTGQWRTSIEHMPQEIDKVFRAAGIIDELNYETPGRKFQYHVGPDLQININRSLRLVDDDMSTVTFTLPNEFFRDRIINDFIPEALR